MGATYFDVTIRNPSDSTKSWTGSFLVDTGAFDSLVPRRHLEAIGLQPKGRREYQLADGKKVAYEITTADLEFEGELVGGTLVYGEDGAEPLLGMTALESGGFRVDRRGRNLKRVPVLYGIAHIVTDKPTSLANMYVRPGDVQLLVFDKAGRREGELVVKVPNSYEVTFQNGTWIGSIEEDHQYRTYRSGPVSLDYSADAPPSRYRGKLRGVYEPRFFIAVHPVDAKLSVGLERNTVGA